MTDMADMNDNMVFADESGGPAAQASAADSWQVLLVDDEPDMHAITTLTLDGLRWGGRSVEFQSAYTIDGAKALLRDGDFALMLVDVQIEHVDAAELLIHYVRQDLGDQAIRMIVRSGTPDYNPPWMQDPALDVTGFVDKSLGTVDRLRSTVVEALMDYNQRTR